MNGDSDVLSISTDSAAENMQTLLLDKFADDTVVLLSYDTIIVASVTSVVGWTSLYYLLCISLPHHSSEWHCRCVTALHAVIVVILSAWSVFVQGPWPFTDPGTVSLPCLL